GRRSREPGKPGQYAGPRTEIERAVRPEYSGSHLPKCPAQPLAEVLRIRNRHRVAGTDQPGIPRGTAIGEVRPAFEQCDSRPAPDQLQSAPGPDRTAADDYDISLHPPQDRKSPRLRNSVLA